MEAADPTSIEVVVFDGFDELDAIGPYEVLENAATAGADAAVDLVTVDDATTVTGSHGLTVASQGPLSEWPDVLVVPGGGWNDRADDGAWAAVQSGDIPDAIRASHEQGTTIASVCTGAMIAEAAGVFDGRRATTHAGAIEDLQSAGVETVDARVVDEGDVLSAGGVTAGIDLAFRLVERFWGEAIATKVATEMEYEPSKDVFVGE
jgi:transcriptional regulator GlxA family with amidase domain